MSEYYKLLRWWLATIMRENNDKDNEQKPMSKQQRWGKTMGKWLLLVTIIVMMNSDDDERQLAAKSDDLH